jgi:hypothetical protein
MRTIYHFIPHEKLTLETHISKEEILKRIAENTTDTPIRGFRWLQKGSAADRRFTGQISESEFDIEPNITYRNSFLPSIKGQIGSDGIVSRIHLQLRLHAFFRVFGILWLLIFVPVSIAIIVAKVSSGESVPFQRYSILLLVVLAAFMGGFKYESIKARKFLITLLEAKEIES